MGDLGYVKEAAILHRANAGFSYDYQLVDVPDYCGRGGSAPFPWFFQNEGEVEYIVSLCIYTQLLGYPANKISILNTYYGQNVLSRDVINRFFRMTSLVHPSRYGFRSILLLYNLQSSLESD